MNDQIDKYNLRKVILEGPRQFMEGFEAAKNIKPAQEFDSIMISGMGGSALPGNIVRIILHDILDQYDIKGQRLRIYQNRFYSLPGEAYENCLNFICSHSGNTEETIASFEEAIKHNLPCVGISSGGKIEEMCKEFDIPHIKLPIPFENFQPRMATGHFVATIMQVLMNTGKFPDVTGEVLKETEDLMSRVKNSEEKGKEIAKTLVGKTPIIYANTHFKALAMIWKIKINENSKTPAFWNYFPELNHNEMVGFTRSQADFSILMLRDAQDDPRNQKRYDVMAKILKENDISTMILDIEGDTVYSRVFRTLYLGDWVSYYLALEYSIDPTPVDMVEDFKKMLV